MANFPFVVVPHDVNVAALIGPDGFVIQTEGGVADVVEETFARGAVFKWRYEPTVVDGCPVSVVMTVKVPFGR